MQQSTIPELNELRVFFVNRQRLVGEEIATKEQEIRKLHAQLAQPSRDQDLSHIRIRYDKVSHELVDLRGEAAQISQRIHSIDQELRHQLGVQTVVTTPGRQSHLAFPEQMALVPEDSISFTIGAFPGSWSRLKINLIWIVGFLVVLLVINFVAYRLLRKPLEITAPVSSASLSSTSTDTYHHLGDNVINTPYVVREHYERFHHEAPEGLAYYGTFDLWQIRALAGVSAGVPISKLAFTMVINHLKPRRSAAVRLFINGGAQPYAYLNDYVQSEEFKVTPIHIIMSAEDVARDIIPNGINQIEISTSRDQVEFESGFDEYEDLEFGELAVSIQFDRMVLDPSMRWILLIDINLLIIFAAVVAVRVWPDNKVIPIVIGAILEVIVNASAAAVFKLFE
jgi:hypothetical protein